MDDAAVERVVHVVDIDHGHAHAVRAMERGQRLDRIDQRGMRDDEVVVTLFLDVQRVIGDRPREQRRAQIVAACQEIIDVFAERDVAGRLHRAVVAVHRCVGDADVEVALTHRAK